MLTISTYRVPVNPSRPVYLYLRKGLEIEDPAPLGLYLGCIHEQVVQQKGYVKTTGTTYNMEYFFERCVSHYVTLTKYNKEFRKVPTLFGGRGSEEF